MAEFYGSFQELLEVKRNRLGSFELPEAKKNSKGEKVKLIDALDEEQTMNLPVKSESGNTVYRPVKFVPGKIYLLPEDDVAFRKALILRGKIKRAYSEDFEQRLKKAGVPHEVIRCKSCGGRVKKIEVQRIEVIGDE